MNHLQNNKKKDSEIKKNSKQALECSLLEYLHTNPKVSHLKFPGNGEVSKASTLEISEGLTD